MTAKGEDLDRPSDAARWWEVDRLGRIAVSAVMWALLGISSGCAVVGVAALLLGEADLPHDLGQVFGFAIAGVFGILLGRAWVVAAAVSGEYLLVRRAISRRAERIPIASIRRAQYHGATWIVWQNVIRVFVPPLGLLLILEYRSLFGRAGAEAWEGLKADLRRALGDRWKE